MGALHSTILASGFALLSFVAQGLSTAQSRQILPFHLDDCVSGSLPDVNLALSELKADVLGSGETANARMLFLVSRTHEYAYFFKVEARVDDYSACLVGGAREIDLMGAEVVEGLREQWSPRRDRHHLALAQRVFQGSIPISRVVADIDPDDAVPLFTGYFVKPDWSNTYDEVPDLKVGGEKLGLSRGQIMSFANKSISEMDSGTKPMNARNRRDYDRMLEAVDHGLHLVLLVVDRTDGDWSLIQIDRRKDSLQKLLGGKNFKLRGVESREEHPERVSAIR